MLPANRKEMVNRALQRTTKDIIPVFQLSAENLRDTGLFKAASESLDNTIHKTLSNLCIEMINVVTRSIFEELLKSPPQGSAGFFGCQTAFVITEVEVGACLGDAISLALCDAMGVPKDISYQSSEEMTKLVVKEVTERINIHLAKSSKSCEGRDQLYQPHPRTVRLMVKHVMDIMKKMSERVKTTKAKMPGDASTQQGEFGLSRVLFQAVGGENIPFAGGNVFAAEEAPQKILTEIIKEILNKQGGGFTVISEHNVSKSEYELLVSSTSMDINNVASEISAEIVQSFQTGTLDVPQSKSGPEAKSSLWKQVERKIKALIVQRFAKELILRLVTNLKWKFMGLSPLEETLSLQKLFEAGGRVVERMIPMEEDQESHGDIGEVCLYERIASSIQTGKQEFICKQLGDVIFYHLRPKGRMMHFQKEIQVEVDFFMNAMWNWLNQQARQDQSQRTVNKVLEKIKAAVTNLTAPTDLLGSGTDPLTCVFEDGAASKPVVAEELGSVACEPAIDEGAGEGPLEGASHPGDEWGNLCDVLVTDLVGEILQYVTAHVPADAMKSITSKLKEMLLAETEGYDLPAKRSDRHIAKVITAVHKELSKKMGTKEWIRINLLLQEDGFYKNIIKIVVKHLLTPTKKTGVKRFFKAVGNMMAKPFKPTGGSTEPVAPDSSANTSAV